MLDFLLLLLVAGVCGGVAQALVGYSHRGWLASIALGFVGALLGSWLAGALGVGELLATVFTSGAESTGEGCALTPVAWDATAAACEEVAVRGQKVAVADVTPTAGDGLPPAQWAGFRHEDGTVVFVMQTAEVPRSGRPALTAMPMTSAQLADLATDPRLKPR